MTPSVSVVVPSYNEEAGIERCLASLADQTLPRNEYEVIVVDGNSKDRTRELAAPYADAVLIQTSPKVGGARNDGVLAASAPLIATTDADCVLPRDWVERVRDDLGREGVVLVYGTVRPIEATLKNRLSLGLANLFSALGYRTGRLYYTLGCNCAFRKDAFVRAGMYRTIDAGDDLEIAGPGERVAEVRQPEEIGREDHGQQYGDRDHENDPDDRRDGIGAGAVHAGGWPGGELMVLKRFGTIGTFFPPS